VKQILLRSCSIACKVITMADAKEQARLKMKADANFQRNLRFKDSRLRTIGVDVNALNMQVAEKKRIKEEEIEAAKIERKLSILVKYHVTLSSVI